MGFEAEHGKWLEGHLKRRSGERLDALRRGHGYGNRLFVEQVWWELAGHFSGLHPEYEVKDWRGRSYYADFMWMVRALRFVFEIMDYGSHGTDRTKYRLDLNRGLFLQGQGYVVYYIALDELRENPTFIVSALRSSLGAHLAASEEDRGAAERKRFCRIERELMHAAVRDARILRPGKTAREMELDAHTVIKYCRMLVKKGKFRALCQGESGRVTSYEYIGSLQSPDLV